LLGEHFLRYYSRKNNLPELKLTSEDKTRLWAYDWPGNVRELKNVMERAAILRTLREFEIDLKPQSEPSSIHPFADFPKLEELERRYIRYVLEKTNQKIAGPAGAAESLGMKRTTLYSRMKKLHIALP